MKPHIICLLISSGLIAGGLFSPLRSQASTPAETTTPATTPATSPATHTSTKRPGPHPAGMPESAREYYAMTWGVDQLSAKLVESGQLVRFDYRVLDPKKAAPLNERSSSPQMYDEKAHAVLQIPTMEKVGPLRQSMTPEEGKVYWMVFSNKGNLVKPGHRVSVVIGQVRIDGLIVQ
jgi:hypothetical protein